MALEDVREIITRVATDKDFRENFFDPKGIDKVLVPYKDKLTSEERQCLYGLTPGRVEEYVSKEDLNVYSCSDIRI